MLSPCNLRDSLESFPTTQLESIDSLALSLLHGPSLWSHLHMTTGKTIVLTIGTFVTSDRVRQTVCYMGDTLFSNPQLTEQFKVVSGRQNGLDPTISNSISINEHYKHFHVIVLDKK